MDVIVSRVLPSEFESALGFYRNNGYHNSVDRNDAIYKARSNDELLGLGRISFEQGTFVLRGMMVSPNHRGKGVGRKILDNLDRTLWDNPASLICPKRLEKFYGQIGFLRVEDDEAPEFLRERKFRYSQEVETDLVLMNRPAGFYTQNTNPACPGQEVMGQVQGLWDLDGPIDFLRQVENYVFSAGSGPSRKVIRMTDPSHRTIEELKAELDWMGFLHEKGVPAVQPFRSSDGQYVETCQHDQRKVYVSVFRWAEGEHIGDLKNYNPEVMRQWGATLARMHVVSMDYEDSRRHPWQSEPSLLFAESSLSDEDPVSSVYHEAKNWLLSLPRERGSFGLIHADLHQGNFFVHEGQLKIFDFDDATFHWFSYDIAVCFYTLFSQWSRRGLEHPKHLEEAFLEGYRSVHQMDTIWFERIESFIHFRRVLLYFWIKSKLQNGDFEPTLIAQVQKSMDESREVLLNNTIHLT